MKFSIIIPTCNSSKTLSKALDSVLMQTYASYEIIIIDGASTDSTIKIIKDYDEKFKGRLRWVSEKDKGVYDAMNKGIDLAKGEWIYFLGSDDILYSKQILEKITEEIKRLDLEVIYGNVQWGETEKIYDGKFSVLKIMNQNICHQSIFFKKSIFKRFGKFEIKYKTLADYVLNIRWFNDTNIKREYINLIVAQYGANGLSSNFQDSEFIKDRDKIINKYFPKEYRELNKNTKIHRLEELSDNVKKLELELNLIKSSKFWKMRNKYMKLKSFFLFKKHL